MCGFLYPWGEQLGFDTQYREDTGGHHQWLDVVLRPSMTGFVIDLYRADGYAKTHDGPPNHMLVTPAAVAYAGRNVDTSEYPCRQPRQLSARPVVVAVLEEGDVAENEAK
mmetsp:Transcript_6615/g.11678  ORF Transcript_6615/g.11678 Transcript_6615/m.11678 type:complete len:110 (+) Transcript_6615:68-397(+)